MTMDKEKFLSRSVTLLSQVLILYWILVLVSSVAGLLLVARILDPQFLGFDIRETGMTTVRVAFTEFLLLFRTLLWVNIPLSLISITSAVGLLNRLNPARYITIATLGIAFVLGIYALVKAMELFQVRLQDNPSQSTAGIWIMIIGSAVTLLVFSGLAGYISFRLLSQVVRAEFE